MLETFKGFKGVKEEITARYNMHSGRKKEISFHCTAVHANANAIAVAVHGAVWIMLLTLLPFGYFATQECNGVCHFGHLYGCIDV